MPLPSAFTAVIGNLSGRLDTGRKDEKPDFAGLVARSAAGTDAHKLGAVLDLGEAALARHGASPVVEPAVVDLLDAAAYTAGEVMVVAAPAEHERLLAVRAAQRVGRALVRQPLEVAVHGREADALELAVQLLRRHGAVGRAEGVEDRLALLGLAAHRTQTIVILN